MTTLSKSLGVVRGTGLMLNIAVGAGLLALPGLAVEAAGDQALWSWLACAMILSFAIAVALYVAMGFIVQAGDMTGAPEAAFVGIARSLFGGAGSLAVGTLAAVIILANLLGAL